MNPRQKFLEHAVAVGLDTGTISTADVVKHCDPKVLADHLPPDLKAKLLQACLNAATMDADTIVDVIGTEALAENVPMHVMWACIAEAAGRALGDSKAAGVAASKSKSKSNPTKKTAAAAAKSKAPTKPPPGKKPAVAKSTAAAKPPAAKPAPPAASKAAKTKSVASGTNRTRVPRNEFDVDTDVGEDVAEDVADVDNWDDDIVEVVEEDVIGASTSVLDEIASNGGVSDWSKDEETVTRDVTKR